MDAYLLWLLAGLALVIVELLTGTFYLLVLGAAAFAAGAAAWLGGAFPAQAITAALIAFIGAYFVHAYRARNLARQMPSIDGGQPASFEHWVDEGARLARVRYRGASWDARLEDAAAPQPGALLYVLATEGNRLRVSARPPA
ncbi:MAG TPA: NfeD family protein [Burkholderiales bacterium]|nr:NfeD family protein [Burkholderiales bacterium]